jgi:hypothetical protein
MPITAPPPLSSFPTLIDDWGQAHTNDNCDPITAFSWNKITAALVQMGFHSIAVLQSGQAGVLTHPTTGSLRPKVLLKAFDITASGAEPWMKLISMPSFTQDEKDLFDGSPLSINNSIHLWVRKDPPNALGSMAYQCSLVGNITDDSGDSGWQVALTPLGNDQGDRKIVNGNYVVTMIITNN